MLQRVLLVDDEEVDNFIHKKIIENANFCNDIVICTSSKDALTYLANNVDQLPELILLDVKMPAMNGYEFLQSFRKFPSPIKDTCHIFALSSLLDQEEIKRIKELPFISGFFSKPLNESKLNELKLSLTSRTDLSKNSRNQTNLTANTLGK
ncbi:MAG: response regulator [Cyclobacteriaceae bacterium]